MGTLVNSGVIRSVKEVWWDIRPHPELGTVELRMCDASPTFREVAALAALAQCLVADAVARFDAGDLPPPPRPWTTRENRWLASRHGVTLPIATEVAAVLFEGKAPAGALASLLGRAATREDAPVGERHA